MMLQCFKTEYFVKVAREKRITPIWWDNGQSASGKSEIYCIFNRNTLTWEWPEVEQAFVRGANSKKIRGYINL